MQISPQEKWLLLGGGVIVVIAVFLHAKGSASTTSSAGAVASGSTNATAPISTGSLANFESALTSQQDAFLSQLQATLARPAPSGSGTTTQTSPAPTVTTLGGTSTGSGSSSAGSSSSGSSSAGSSSAGSSAGSTRQQSSTPVSSSPAPTAESASSSGAYALVPGAGGSEFAVLGRLGSGGQYSGANVSGGAPVYALVHGSWIQGFDAAQLPAGTPLATPTAYAGHIIAGSGSETLP